MSGTGDLRQPTSRAEAAVPNQKVLRSTPICGQRTLSWQTGLGLRIVALSVMENAGQMSSGQ